MTNELETRRCTQERWRVVTRAVGMDSPSHKPEETFFLASDIMADAEVEKLRRQKAFQIQDPEFPCASEPNWPKIGSALGPAGRAALAERLRNRK